MCWRFFSISINSSSCGIVRSIHHSIREETVLSTFGESSIIVLLKGQ